MKRFLAWLRRHLAQFSLSLAAGIGPGLFSLYDAARAHDLARVSLGIVQTDTTPTLNEMVSNVSTLAASWGIYIAAGLIFGLAVFAVYRFVRSGR